MEDPRSQVFRFPPLLENVDHKTSIYFCDFSSLTIESVLRVPLFPPQSLILSTNPLLKKEEKSRNSQNKQSKSEKSS